MSARTEQMRANIESMKESLARQEEYEIRHAEELADPEHVAEVLELWSRGGECFECYVPRDYLAAAVGFIRAGLP